MYQMHTVMLRLIFLVLAITCFAGCSNASKKKAQVVTWVDGIMAQYPNMQSNEISASAVKDSVKLFAESFIGQRATLLEGVTFKFRKMMEKKDSFAVFFDARGCFSDIESKTVDKEHLITDINMRVVGKVDKQTAATLDKEKSYALSGTLHAWDAEDRFFITNHVGGCIDLGTFILNEDIEISAVEK